MKRWTVRQLFGVVLAIFVAAGLGLSVVQASHMAATMTMAVDKGVSGEDGCAGCPGGGSDSMKMAVCASVCVAPLLAVLPQAAPMPGVQTPPSFPSRDLLLIGRTSAPELHPPKPAHLG